MKFGTENYLKLKNLLDNAIPSSDKEIHQIKYTVPGLYRNIFSDNSPFKIWTYSLENKELKEFISNLFNQDPTKITSIHRLKYVKGGSAIRHVDRANCTFVLILDADLQEGGEFYLNDIHREDFKETGDYLLYDGGSEYHEVKEIKKGYRDVLVVFWVNGKLKKTLL